MEQRLEVQRSNEYRTIIVSGIFGGHRPGFIEALIYSDELVGDAALGGVTPDASKIQVKRTMQCRLFIDPVTAKSIAEWLTGHIVEYEKQFGQIPTGPQTKLPDVKSRTATYG